MVVPLKEKKGSEEEEDGEFWYMESEPTVKTQNGTEREIKESQLDDAAGH